MTNVYATLEDLNEITTYDIEKYSTVMQFMLDAAAQHIERVTHRNKWMADTVASARLYSGNGKSFIDIDEAVEITAIGFKFASDDTSFTALTTDDYIAYTGRNENPDFNSKPYTKIMVNPSGDYSTFPIINDPGNVWLTERPNKSLRRPGFPNIQVTAKWGYSVDMPQTIKACVIIQATRYIKRAQATFGDAISNTNTGQILFVRKMDNDISSMLLNGGLIRVQV